MKISILLPYKENFSPTYAGAVSLFVNDTLKISKYKKVTTVYGNTKFKKIFNHNYKNIDLKANFLESQSKKYVQNFVEIEKENNSDLIELHNRPIYIKYLSESLMKKNYILYFHNDPLSMIGSKSIEDRVFLFNKCFKIIFNSKWSRKRFLKGMPNYILENHKLIVINQSARKNKINYSSLYKGFC